MQNNFVDLTLNNSSSESAKSSPKKRKTAAIASSSSSAPKKRKTAAKKPADKSSRKKKKPASSSDEGAVPSNKVSGFARLDQIYTGLQEHKRTMWFWTVRDHCPTVFPVLSASFGGDRHASSKTVVTINLDSDAISLTGRQISKIQEALDKGRRYVWIPITLSRRNYATHSNAIWVDTQLQQFVLFEPHGSDASHQAHPPGFRNMYHSARYFQAMRQSLVAAFPRYGVTTPDQYEPPVFGQSLSGVKNGADPWCVLWTLYFFYHMTFRNAGNYRGFVTFIENKRRSGELPDFIKGLLQDLSWMNARECV
jgi:hypothetical protein